jgi:hypothetical protein
MFIADLDGERQYTSEDLSWADCERRISTDKRTSSDRPIAGEKPTSQDQSRDRGVPTTSGWPTIRSGCKIEC